MRPLRRKPKELSAEPALLEATPPSGAGGGPGGPGGPRTRSVIPSAPAGSGGPSATDEQGALTTALGDPQRAVDAETLRRAR